MPNYLSKYDADTLPAFHQCVVFNGTQVIFTPVGIARYKERFARAGFDIAKVTDAESLSLALEGSWQIETECFAEVSRERRSRSSGNELEWARLDALRKGERQG